MAVASASLASTDEDADWKYCPSDSAPWLSRLNMNRAARVCVREESRPLRTLAECYARVCGRVCVCVCVCA